MLLTLLAIRQANAGTPEDHLKALPADSLSKCDGPLTPHTLSQSEKSLTLTIDSNIREKLMAAADQLFSIGERDPVRGTHVDYHSINALGIYRALGVPEAVIAEKVNRRLSDFFATESRLETVAVSLKDSLPPSPTSTEVTAQNEFITKHELARFHVLRTHLPEPVRLGFRPCSLTDLDLDRAQEMDQCST